MATYEIHGPLVRGEREAAAEAFETTKVGFSYTAFVFAPFWLAAHRLWLPLAVYLVGGAVALALSAFDLISPGAVFLLAFAAAIFVGLEGPNWRSAALARRGSPLLDLVEASSATDAAYLYIVRGIAGLDNGATAVAPRETGPVSPRRDPHVLGLFPEAQR